MSQLQISNKYTTVVIFCFVANTIKLSGLKQQPSFICHSCFGSGSQKWHSRSGRKVFCGEVVLDGDWGWSHLKVLSLTRLLTGLGRYLVKTPLAKSNLSFHLVSIAWKLQESHISHMVAIGSDACPKRTQASRNHINFSNVALEVMQYHLCYLVHYKQVTNFCLYPEMHTKDYSPRAQG